MAVARCRDQLLRKGTCSIADALLPEGAALLLQEVTSAKPALSDKYHTVYQTPRDDTLPETHARNRMLHARIGFVGRSLLAEPSLLTGLYETPDILQFVGEAAGEELFLSEDGDGSVYATVNHAGYCTAWHFDQHPYSAAIVLQAPASGGEFQWVNNATDGGPEETDERVVRLLDGDLLPRSSTPVTGTLTLFRGEHTLHQVSAVGEGTRVSVVLAFAREPGFANSDLVKNQNKWDDS